MNAQHGPMELARNYLRLRPDSTIEILSGGNEFWGQLMKGELGNFRNEYLVTTSAFSQDWPSWENHVNGDEIVYLLSGKCEFLLELPDGTAGIVVDKPGQYVKVPKNTWHTAKTTVPTTMLFITAGEGTQIRQKEQSGS